MARIAINGFGRIGRLFFRQAFEKFDIVAINDLADLEQLAYLLRHDTVYWAYDKEVRVSEENGKRFLVVAGKKIIVLREKDPTRLPWNALRIDVVVESSGMFEEFTKARSHIAAGAKRVVITAPAKDEEQDDAKTVLLGINEDQFKTSVITSNGSCTTNVTHPVAAIIHETIGVQKASLVTVHGYTATQNLVDGVARGSDVRRGRAAGANIVPSASGVTVSVTRAIQYLQGRFDGLAVRVPVITGSFADFTFVAKRLTTVAEVNGIFVKAGQDPRWKDILAVTDEPLVSSDIVGTSYGSIIDLSLTRVIDGDLVKVFSWYDNEWGYVATLVRHVEKVAAII